MDKVIIAEKSGNIENIEIAITEILKKDPINKEAIQRLIALRIQQGNNDEAISLLQKYNEIYMETQAFVQLAELYCTEVRYNDAFDIMQEVVMMEPSNFYMWQFAGEIALQLNAVKEARKMFLTACKLSDYKYVRALKSTVFVLGLSKESKTKSEAIAARLQQLLDEYQPSIDKQKRNFF
ncbi:hypothetical protein ENUP19_0047G0007 [Entamoeba nuttalli]|uniref:ER membrane protein complex subunit 2 n=2 Tax=Entamoeba nuttalli TaxID=412467 RepID=K2GDT5_ENTNP|nr:tetratricopeptide repeat domain containing protein [Entamoeba nuttalli P19]EKE40706.1 tetratricopeptide repeat domain containing protein [Entamoeba nuttalli P19]|eukprot:XP_008856961.1 tetratricopeptide repeat domain containing protein [Entamoeba nuttalli P19]